MTRCNNTMESSHNRLQITEKVIGKMQERSEFCINTEYKIDGACTKYHVTSKHHTKKIYHTYNQNLKKRRKNNCQ